MTPALDALHPRLQALCTPSGTISIWAGPVGGPPVFARDADATHYAASTTKVAILVALFRAVEARRLSLDEEIEVRNEFASVRPELGTFEVDVEDDNDDEVATRLGQTAPLGWLAERMIVRSSNVATNLVLARVGVDATNEVWRSVGATRSMTDRGIEDPARLDGVNNLVTAADLAALFSAIALGTAASPESCEMMMDILLAQEYRDDLPAGLPPGTPIATKNGWVNNVRHGAAVVLPTGEPPFVLVVCTTTTLGHDEGATLLAKISEAAWHDRKSFT
jgi:beta-lactamase class A